jgi:drug/metabolite transporter (DMT)-like permease
MKAEDLTFIKTLLLINVSEILFCVSNSVNHECTRNRGITVVEYSLFRNLLNLSVTAILARANNVSLVKGIKGNLVPKLVLRTAIGNTYVVYTWTFKLLPLGIATTLISTSPLALVCFARLNNERALISEQASLLVSFAGITAMSLSGPTSEAHSDHSYLLGVGLALFVAFAEAITTVLSRVLSSVDTLVVMFYHMLSGVISSLICSMFDHKGISYFHYESLDTYCLLAVGGMANCAAMLIMIYSTQHCRSPSVALLGYIGVLYSFFVDFFVFNEAFTQWQLIGALAILMSNVCVILYKMYAETKDSKQEESTD